METPNKKAKVSVVLNKTELPDSLEIGTPSKGGVKVYLDFADPALCERKMAEAFQHLQLAKQAYDEMQQPIQAKQALPASPVRAEQ